jgi:hypothetical protein
MNYQQTIEKLEQLYSHKPETQSKRSVGDWLKQIWRSLVVALSQNSEIRVWKTVDKTGRSLWKLYDPSTGETLDFDSETEVRTWIEESYNRLPTAERNFRPFYS